MLGALLIYKQNMSGERLNKNDDEFVRLDAEAGPAENDTYRGEDRYGPFSYRVGLDGTITEADGRSTSTVMTNTPRWERFKVDHPEDAKRLMDIATKRRK